MANVKVTLKDGSVKEVAAGTTLLEVAKGLSQKLGKQALLAVVDGVNKDLTDKLEHDASVEFVVPESSEGLYRSVECLSVQRGCYHIGTAV